MVLVLCVLITGSFVIVCAKHVLFLPEKVITEPHLNYLRHRAEMGDSSMTHHSSKTDNLCFKFVVT